MIDQQDISLRGIFKFFESYLRKLYALIEQLHKQLGEKSKSKQLEEAQAEIRRLKNLPKKPNIKPSELDKPKKTSSPKEDKRRPGSDKVSKKRNLKIHEEKEVKAKDVPQDWIFKGYKPYVIQDLLIRATAHLQGKQFGETLQAFILQQYYDCAVTQPLLHTSLKDYGVQISSGQISNILIENKESFHEQDTVLKMVFVIVSIVICLLTSRRLILRVESIS